MSFISAEEAVQNALQVSDEKLVENVKYTTRKIIEEFILDMDKKIREVSKHGGTSTSVYVSKGYLLKYGKEVYNVVNDDVLPHVLQLIVDNMPEGYTAEYNPYPGIDVSWGSKTIKFNCEEIDQKTMLDKVFYGDFKRNLPRNTPSITPSITLRNTPWTTPSITPQNTLSTTPPPQLDMFLEMIVKISILIIIFKGLGLVGLSV